MTFKTIEAVVFVLFVIVMIWQVIHPLLNGENVFPIFRKPVDNNINTKE
jgi:hypothetical protein